MSDSEIDSDDDFVICVDCEIEVDVAEVCIYKKDKFCKNCYEECRKLDVAQPVRMVYKICEDISYSCCGSKNCVRIQCCGTVKGHVYLSSCDPEIVNYPLGLAGIFSKTNMHRCPGDAFMSNPFEETNLLRRLRLQKTERLEKEKEELKVKSEKLKAKKEKEKEKEKLKVKSEKRIQQKERWDNLTIGTKIAQLEVQICHKIHPGFLNVCGYGDGGLGQRLMLYENDRFKELQKTCPVIEQASRAIYNFAQPPHLQIENPYEKKDQPEKILVILEKWLEETDPSKYRELKGVKEPPSPPFEKVSYIGYSTSHGRTQKIIHN